MIPGNRAPSELDAMVRSGRVASFVISPIRQKLEMLTEYLEQGL